MRTFFGSDCICEICALVQVLACFKRFKGVPKAAIFLTFSEPTAKDASEAPFVEFGVYCNVTLASNSLALGSMLGI